MRTSIITASALVLTLAFAWPAGAQDAPQIDPRAEYLLGQMSQLLAATDGFIVTADVSEDEVTEWGQLIEVTGTVQMSVRRPNRLSVDARRTVTHKQFFYDGSQMTLFDVVLHAHASSDAPDTIDATVDAAMAEYGVSLPVADLAFSDPAASLLEHAVAGHYVGPVTVDGRPCHHLAFTTDAVDWQIWIEDGHQPVPRRLVAIFKAVEGSPRYSVVFREWDLAPSLPDSLFEFVPPPNSQEIDFLPTTATEGGE